MSTINPRTIEDLNTLSPDVLYAHGIIKLVENKTNEYICPICGNGSGEDATGIKPHVTASHVGYICHRCGERFDNIRLIALAYGLDPQRDFQAVVDKACAVFGITLIRDNDKPIQWQRKKETSTPIPAKKETTPADELKLIRSDLAADDAALIQFVNHRGGSWRGLPADLLLKFGCRFIAKWTSPKSRVANKFSTPTPRLIVPCSDEAYLARLTCSLDDFDETARQYVKPKQHAGAKSLFNSDALTVADVVFVVEGAIDAMSIEYVGYHACATGGADSYKLAVDVIKALEEKPHVIILFDADDTGRKEAPKLQAALLDVGCLSSIQFVSDDDTKLDCNEILTTQGEDNLRGVLADMVDNAQNDFETAADAVIPFDETARAFYFGGSCTDKDNARRLEKFCGDKIRWLTDDERWLVYANGVWRHGSDKNSHVLPFALELSDKLLASAPLVEDPKTAKKAFRIGYAFADQKKYNPAITTLKGINSIRITAGDLDQHPNLLNVQNGIIDLETKKLYDAAPELLLTQQVSVAYDDRTDCHAVNKFFRDIMPDEMTRAGLIRWLGYCLTGSVCEEKFLVWLGDGANGKGVLSRLMSALLCNYAAALPRNALLVNSKLDDGNAHTAALVPLIGARFAISEELPQNITLDASLLKTLTGGDIQIFRPLYRNFIKATPTAKINMSSNHIPKLSNVDDDGMERRLIIMPFTQQFKGDRADPHLKEKLLLKENLQAFLQMLVDAAFDWYRDGLIVSDAMKAATRDNLDANDFISDFLSEYCDVGGGKGEMPRVALLDKLKDKTPQARRFSDRELCKMIEKRGVRYVRGKHGFVFKGVKFLTDDDFVGEPIDKNDIPFDD